MALSILVATAAVAGADDTASPSGRLTVRAQARRTTCYVGQTVDLYVGVVAGPERPELTAPDVPGAALVYVGTSLRPLAVSGIGDAVFERLLYRAHYRLTPRRAGEFTVGPFAARIGGRRGASEPLRLSARKPPEAGRPAEFLGGVGPFDVEAWAEPDAVRSGQTIDYEVTVTGPAARGVTSAPDVSRLERLPIGLRVERRPDRETDDPPTHTFVYRLRPTRAGAVTLPPVRVAAFDPETSHYQTRATQGVPVRVVDVPRLDPSALESGRSAGGAPRALVPMRTAAAGVIAGASLLTCAYLVGSAWRRARPTREVRRICREAIRALTSASTAAGRGRAISDGLVAYLGRTIGRPPGALTPDDAREGVARASGSDDLAARAERLVRRCDAARFDPGTPTSDDLVDAGRRVFLDLEGHSPRGAAAGGIGGGKTR